MGRLATSVPRGHDIHERKACGSPESFKVVVAIGQWPRSLETLGYSRLDWFQGRKAVRQCCGRPFSAKRDRSHISPSASAFAIPGLQIRCISRCDKPPSSSRISAREHIPWRATSTDDFVAVRCSERTMPLGQGEDCRHRAIRERSNGPTSSPPSTFPPD